MSELDTTPQPHSAEKRQHVDIFSLYIVKSEIESSLNQVEAALNIFMSDQSNIAVLLDSVDLMQQTSNVLKLLKLEGAIELSVMIQQMLVSMTENPNAIDDYQITALSESLMTLTRYLGFVLLQEKLSPQLLLPITNMMHRLLNQPMISDGYFLLNEINEGLIQKNIESLVTPAISAERISEQDRKHLAGLFQTGLNGILQKKSKVTDYIYIQKAVSYIADREPPSSEALYWQLAKQIVLSMSPNTLLTHGRKRILAQMERRIVRKSASMSRLSQTDAIADLLTMTAIAPQNHTTIISKLGLTDKIKPDADILTEKQFLFGPDQSVVHDVSVLVHQSIRQIKEMVDAIVNEEQQDGGLNTLFEALKTLGNTLVLLNLDNVGQDLLEQANTVAKWSNQPSEKDINILMDHLLDSENAVIFMEQKHTPGLTMLPFINLKISLHQLVEARSLIVSESRLDLKKVMDTLLEFLNAEKDPQNIEVMAAVCEAVSGAMAFLNAPRGQAILQSVARYIRENFSTEHDPDPCDIKNLMDAIICVDYVLEGMESQKPAGDLPYGYGENGLANLGYPVKSAA
jgi:hypothetical protein